MSTASACTTACWTSSGRRRAAAPTGAPQPQESYYETGLVVPGPRTGACQITCEDLNLAGLIITERLTAVAQALRRSCPNHRASSATYLAPPRLGSATRPRMSARSPNLSHVAVSIGASERGLGGHIRLDPRRWRCWLVLASSGSRPAGTRP
jgi:hypothetical protein